MGGDKPEKKEKKKTKLVEEGPKDVEMEDVEVKVS